MYHIFQHWIKKNLMNFPHRHQTYWYEWSISVRDDDNLNMEKGMHWSIYHIFQHWVKKNKINIPHRHQTYGYV